MAAPTFSTPVLVAEPTYRSSAPGFLGPIAGVLERISAARDALNLPDPGKAEDLGREVKSESIFLATRTPLLYLHTTLRGLEADDFLLRLRSIYSDSLDQLHF